MIGIQTADGGIVWGSYINVPTPSDPSSTKTDVDSGHFNDMVKDFAKTKFCRFKPMLLK
jgi:hypothetical protein